MNRRGINPVAKLFSVGTFCFLAAAAAGSTQTSVKPPVEPGPFRPSELVELVKLDPTIKLGHMGVQEYKGDFGNDILYPMIIPGQKVA